MRRKLLTDLRATVWEAKDRVLAHPFLEKAQSHELDERELMRFFFCTVKEEAVFPFVIVGTLQPLDLKRAFRPAFLALSRVLFTCMGEGLARHSHQKEIVQFLTLAGKAEESLAYEPQEGLKCVLELETGMAYRKHGPLDVTLGYTLTRNALLNTCYNVIQFGCKRLLSDEREALLHHRTDTGNLHGILLWKAVNALPSDSHANVGKGISYGKRVISSLLDEALGVYGSSGQSQ